MSKRSRALLSLFVLPLAPLFAQNFGEITGAVMDPTGAVVAAAHVTIVNTATNQTRQTTTNDSGNYSAPYLAPGLYDVRVENPGFKVATRKGVDLQVDAVARIDFKMEVGEVTQQMEVTGGAPQLKTGGSSISR